MSIFFTHLPIATIKGLIFFVHFSEKKTTKNFKEIFEGEMLI